MNVKKMFCLISYEQLINLYEKNKKRNSFGDIGILFLNENEQVEIAFPDYEPYTLIANMEHFRRSKYAIEFGNVSEKWINQDTLYAICDENRLIEQVNTITDRIDMIPYLKQYGTNLSNKYLKGCNQLQRTNLISFSSHLKKSVMEEMKKSSNIYNVPFESNSNFYSETGEIIVFSKEKKESNDSYQRIR